MNVTPLKWSENLSAQAQKCADYNAANFLGLWTAEALSYSRIRRQNIALATSSLYLNRTQMVDAWWNEKRNFLNEVYPSISATGSS